MKNIIYIVLVTLFIFPIIVYGNTNMTAVQKYLETTDDNQIEYNYSVTKIATGFLIELSSANKKEKCFTDSAYYCQLWEYSCPANNTRFTAERKNNLISLAGTLEGQKIDKKIKISNLPWLQFWEYGITNMIESNNDSMKFISIDANKPKKTATFKVKNKGIQKLDINNQEEDAIHFVVSIKGLPAFIFQADFWFRKADNLFLRSEMPQGPTAPITRMQILN
jgi:hypothetical protein